MKQKQDQELKDDHSPYKVTESYTYPSTFVGCYEIGVAEYLDENWSEWFEGWRVIHTKDSTTILQGEAIDQSALYGQLAKLRDLNLTLISVRRREVGPDTG